MQVSSRQTARLIAVRALLLLAVAALAVLVAGPVAAAPSSTAPSADPSSAAAASAPETISWTVEPATADGPDGRAWAELTLDPGQSVTDHLAIRNLSKSAATFSIKAADGYFTDTGRFNMLPSSQPSTAAGTWIDVQDSVEVPAGGTVVLPYTVTVPDNATPGDHAAGIAASVSFVGQNPDGGGTLGVESRVGFRVITRVTGDVQPAMTATGLAATYDMSANPLSPGSMQVSTVLANTGNIALAITGTATAGGQSAPFAIGDAGATAIELLPGDQRTVTANVTGVWPLGPVGTTARFTATATDADPVTVSADTTTWAMPWPQLIALAVLALLVLALLANRRRRRAKLRRLLDAERAAGRAEASGETASTAT